MQCRVKERMIRRQEEIIVECFKCEEKGHKCRECSKRREERVRKVKEKKAVCMARPQEAQQKE